MRNIILLMILVSVILAGCKKKEEIEGCTNNAGLNYDEEATIDNGSCQFAYYLVFGLTDEGYQNYQDSGVVYLNIEVDGLPETLDSVPLNDFYSNGTNCEADKTNQLYVYDMVDSVFHTSVTVIDDKENVRLEKSISIDAGLCTKVNIDL